MTRSLAALALVATLALAACTSGSEATATPTTTPTVIPSPEVTPTPTPTLTPSGTPTPTATARPVVSTPTPPPVSLEDGVPAGAIGPLLVFAKEVTATEDATRLWPRFAIVTYDLGAERIAASFEVGTVGSYPSVITLAGREVIVNFERSMYAYAPNGDETRVLASPENADGTPVTFVHDGLVSPDGRLIAILQAREGCDPVCLMVLDVASGAVVTDLPQTAPGLAELGGYFSDPIVWRDDSAALIVSGQPNGERFFGWATVLLDGSVRNHRLDELVTPAPNGRRAITIQEQVLPWVATDPGCDLTTRFNLHDFDEDRVLAEFSEPGSALSETRWSPDGRELLIAWRVLPDGGLCAEEYPRWLAEPASWQLVDTTDGSSVVIDDPEAIQRNWHPEPRLMLTCDGIENEIGSPRLHSCDDGAPVEIVIDGTLIDSGFDVRFLGTIELAAGE